MKPLLAPRFPAAGAFWSSSQRSAAALLLGSLLLTAPAPATAFCGFFVSGADAEISNSASQVVLLRKGNRTTMSMSNNYSGPPQDFAMVVPVPVVLKKEQVQTLATNVFRHIDQLSAPRLVEYWEQDPCYIPPDPAVYESSAANEEDSVEQKTGGGPPRRLGVTIEAKFEVGEYQILILSAKESGGLEQWLRLSKYNIPKGAAAALAPYIREQSKFFVAKVDIKKVKRDKNGLVVLSPLRVSYDAAELRLPVRLGLLNASGKAGAEQDLLVYVLHPESRFEVANYKNVFVPTNIEVANQVRSGFPGFYAALFDETLRRSGGRAVVTEYAWQTTSCDPCPTPPLEASDLFTLGDDSFASAAKPQPAEESGRSRRAEYYGTPPSYVLTRLHTRYSRSTLDADLIFRAAPPLTGGRATYGGGLGDQGGQVQKGGENNFQGRYIIRHYWEGKVACASPRYGVWGGPPGGNSGVGSGGAASVAEDLASAPRSKLSLPSLIQSAVPLLDLAAKPRALRRGEAAAGPAR